MLKEIINKISGKKEKVVDSFRNVDISDLKIPQITIYHLTKDYGEKYVARIWDLNKCTNTLVMKDSLEDIEQDIKQAFDIYAVFPRLPDDDPVIVKTFFIGQKG